jgi:hypothetical protein
VILAINGRFEGFGPTFFVATAADSGYEMGYIGTEIAYTKSGYEVEPGVAGRSEKRGDADGRDKATTSGLTRR